jgi:transposase-like protein
MIDGIILGEHTVLIALGIDFEGKKQVLGLREGDTENSRVAKALLRDLVERGLDPERARLFVIDGAKALRSAIRKIFGDLGVVQRCQLHYAEGRIMPSWDRKSLSIRDFARIQST